MDEYLCPECGGSIGFGESICPHCTADTTSVWDAPQKESSGPKIAPGMGGMDDSPFPPVSDDSDDDNASPFPPADDDDSDDDTSPFPPSDSPFGSPDDVDESSAVPGTGAGDENPFAAASPFGSPEEVEEEAESKPFPPEPAKSKAFPPEDEGAAPIVQSGPHFDIPDIGGKLYISPGETTYGRNEIQGIATKALPDMNAYKNLSRLHFTINFMGGNITIEDQSSTNGTYMGSKKITGIGPQELKEGDSVILPIEEHGTMVQLEMIFKME